MKLAASNIAWKKEQDEEMYAFLQKNGFQGVEIAPTRIFVEAPYEKLSDAKAWADSIREEYQLSIPSMQSIWYGRNENLFASKEERRILLDYTKQAIDFAQAANCHNLVFGCPRNRSYQAGADLSVAVPFFRELGEYAKTHHTVLSMEANPPIYNTNYCNTTKEALELIKMVASEGFLLNLDVGTMIQNCEDMQEIEKYMKAISVFDKKKVCINHVHISEPYLNAIEKRSIHGELAAFLREHHYEGYVSLEVKTQEDLGRLKDMLLYMKEIFGM